MSVMVYDPTRYEVPAGTYHVRLVEVKDKEPFAESRYGKNKEPRLGWNFEVIGPPGNPMLGKILEQNTGTTPTPRSGLVRLLTLMLGRMLTNGERIDPAAFIGREYQALWAVNPKSDEKRLYIASLMAVGAGQPMAPPPQQPTAPPPPPAAGQRQPVPTPPPPPKPKPPAAAPPPPPSIAPIYWVQLPDKQVVEMSKATLQAHLDAGNRPADEVPVMDQAQEAGGWKNAAELGFEINSPF